VAAPSLPGTSYQSDTVEQILFSFYNGELYLMSVTYDQTATKGLTEEDMVKSISAKYGPTWKQLGRKIGRFFARNAREYNRDCHGEASPRGAILADGFSRTSRPGGSVRHC